MEDMEVEAGWREEAIRKRLTELLPEMDAQAGLVSAALSRNQGLRSLLLLHRDNAKKEIKDYCHQLQKMVVDCQRALIDEVTYLTQQKEKRLVREREQLNCVKERIIYCRERAGVVLKIGHESLLRQKGAEVTGEISGLLAANICEAPMDIQYLSFHPVLSMESFKEAESLGYVKSTAIELPDVSVTSLCDQAFVGVTESLLLQVAKKPVPEGANVIEVQITDPRGGYLDWEVEDNADGSYCITYIPEAVGCHHLTVKIYRSHIKGSPFQVNVVEKSEAEPAFECGDKVSRPRITEGAINTVNRMLGRRSLTKRSKSKTDTVAGAHVKQLAEIQNTCPSLPLTCDVMRNEGPVCADDRGLDSMAAGAGTKSASEAVGSEGPHNKPGKLTPARGATVSQISRELFNISVDDSDSLFLEGGGPVSKESLIAEAVVNASGSVNAGQKWIRPGGWLENAKKEAVEGNVESLISRAKSAPGFIAAVSGFQQSKGTERSEDATGKTKASHQESAEPGRSNVQNWRVKQTATNDSNTCQNNRLGSQNGTVNSGGMEDAQALNRLMPEMGTGDADDKQRTKETSSKDASHSDKELKLNSAFDSIIKSEPLSPDYSPASEIRLQVKGEPVTPEKCRSPNPVSSPKMTIKSEPVFEVHSDVMMQNGSSPSGKSESYFKSSGGIRGRGRQVSSTPKKEFTVPGLAKSSSVPYQDDFTSEPVTVSMSSLDAKVTLDASHNITNDEELFLKEKQKVVVVKEVTSPSKRKVKKTIEFPVPKTSTASENCSTKDQPKETTAKSNTTQKPPVASSTQPPMASSTQPLMASTTHKPLMTSTTHKPLMTSTTHKPLMTSTAHKPLMTINLSSVANVPPAPPSTPKIINYSDVAVVFQKTITHSCIEFPIGVHADKDMVALGNSGGDTVLLFSPTGKLSRQIGGQKTFKRPSAVLLYDEKLFIKDDINVHVYDPQGNYRYSFAKCNLKQPYGLVVTPTKTLLLLEHSGGNIFEFYPDGSLASQWPFPPLINVVPRTAKCRFMGIHGHTLVVTDLGINAVHFINLNSKTWEHGIVHERDNAQGHFNEPSGVTFDPAGNVLIADSRNNRIQVFMKDGRFITVLPLPKGKLSRPADIHLTEDGTLYVSNLLGHNVAVFKILY